MTTGSSRARGWLQDLRDHAASRFVELGFPTVRDEEWRFTNVSPIASTEFKLAPPSKLAPEALASFLYADAPLRLVIVSMDTHLASAAGRARQVLSREMPGLTLSLHAASEFASNPAAAAWVEQ